VSDVVQRVHTQDVAIIETLKQPENVDGLFIFGKGRKACQTDNGSRSR
jgi:hypothetical protein